MSSAVSQDYERLEVIVRDDGSRDETPLILQELGLKFSERLRLLPGGTNLGVTGNHNALVRAARGKYIAIIGGDDIALPGKVQRQVEWLEADDRHVLCHHDMEVFDSATNEALYLYSRRIPLRGGSARELLQYPAFCGAPAVMLRASAMPPQLYDSRVATSSDWLMWMEALTRTGVDNPGAGVIPGVFTRYRRHAGNITSSADDYGLAEIESALHILAEAAPTLRSDITTARAERIATYGFRAMLRGEIGRGSSLVRRSLGLSPRGFARALRNGARFLQSTRAASQ